MDQLTPRVVGQSLCEEGMVAEAYKDEKGIWTWAGGLTAAAGVDVLAWKDKPAPIELCLAATIDNMRKTYLPQVLRAFGPHDLTEAELAAALSFHWNTGAIGRATWVRLFKAGKRDQAFASMMEWIKPTSLIARRKREAALFFDGKWRTDWRMSVWRVAKPSYVPRGAHAVDVLQLLQSVMGGR